jgi:hypothetical protein
MDSEVEGMGAGQIWYKDFMTFTARQSVPVAVKENR